MHQAKTHLSKLVAKAAKGEPFIIARAGKPLVKVTAIEEEPKVRVVKRIGFLKGHIDVPDDFNTMGAKEIEEMFYGERD
jgi:prevent-host-death family protein